MDTALVIYSLMVNNEFDVSYRLIKIPPLNLEISSKNIDVLFGNLRGELPYMRIEMDKGVARVYLDTVQIGIHHWRRMRTLHIIDTSKTLDILPEDPYQDIDVLCIVPSEY